MTHSKLKDKVFFSRRNLLPIKIAGHSKGWFPTLEGLRVLKDGSTVATDGHTLIVAESDFHDQDVEPRTLAPDALEDTIKTFSKKSDAGIDLVLEEGAISAQTEGLSYSKDAPDIEGMYPDHRKVVKLSNPVQVCVDRKKLMDLLKVIDAMDPPKGRADVGLVCIEVGGVHDILTLRSESISGKRTIGCLMPYRSEELLELSEWEKNLHKMGDD